MNQIIIIGNLTEAPELRVSQSSGKHICRFTVATNDGYGDKKETNFHRVVCFDKTADNCEKFLSKGSKTAVTGRVKYGNYEKDGRKIYFTDIVASNVEFLSKGEEKPQDDMPPGFEQVQEEIPF